MLSCVVVWSFPFVACGEEIEPMEELRFLQMLSSVLIFLRWMLCWQGALGGTAGYSCDLRAGFFSELSGACCSEC